MSHTHWHTEFFPQELDFHRYCEQGRSGMTFKTESGCPKEESKFLEPRQDSRMAGHYHATRPAWAVALLSGQSPEKAKIERLWDEVQLHEKCTPSASPTFLPPQLNCCSHLIPT